jgi:hypothetical protein
MTESTLGFPTPPGEAAFREARSLAEGARQTAVAAASAAGHAAGVRAAEIAYYRAVIAAAAANGYSTGAYVEGLRSLGVS